MARYYKKHRRKRKRYTGRRKKRVSYKKGRQNLRRLVNQPFQLPRSFTGSTKAPTRQTAFNLTAVAADGTDMFNGASAGAGFLYQLRPNDIAAPWIGTPNGSGGITSVDGAAAIQGPIQGLHSAASPLGTAGYGRAGCVSLSMSLRIHYPKTDSVYNGTSIVRLNSQPIYIWCSMASGNDTSGLKSTPSTDHTIEELRLHEGIKMWKIMPGQTRTCTMAIPSVLKYLRRSWTLSSTSHLDVDATDPASQPQMASYLDNPARQILAQNFQTGPPQQFVPFTDTEVWDKMRYVACNWGYWCPNSAENISVQTTELNTTMEIIQKVRFWEARSMQDDEDKTVT